jgi:hypothetical protein
MATVQPPASAAVAGARPPHAPSLHTRAPHHHPTHPTTRTLTQATPHIGQAHTPPQPLRRRQRRGVASSRGGRRGRGRRAGGGHGAPALRLPPPPAAVTPLAARPGSGPAARKSPFHAPPACPPWTSPSRLLLLRTPPPPSHHHRRARPSPSAPPPPCQPHPALPPPPPPPPLRMSGLQGHPRLGHGSDGSVNDSTRASDAWPGRQHRAPPGGWPVAEWSDSRPAGSIGARPRPHAALCVTGSPRAQGLEDRARRGGGGRGGGPRPW